jgi:hypothetical protein
MSKLEKILLKILVGNADTNISFLELCQLLSSLGFDKRIKGTHHIFSKEGVEEILNVQPKGSKAKAYQVKQVREAIVKYRLGDKDDSV